MLSLALPLSAGAQDMKTVQQLQKLAHVYRYLDKMYVDTVDMQPLVEGAIVGMLDKLDPHSAYIGAEEMKGVEESFDGEFSGIGVEFNMLRDTVVVVNTIAGGPAESVGVMANDRIVRIDTISGVGLRRSDVPKYLRGKRGSKVDIEVIRHGNDEPLHFTLTRDKIPINTVDAAYMPAKGIGYIKVNRFGRTTMTEFREAYKRLKSPQALLLDLRGNGGGLMDQAIEMAGFFLPKGADIVAVEGRAVQKSTFRAQSSGECLRGRLVVLIDESSASASEIVSGAIQDWDRGVIVGRTSFGKGLVQRQIPLGDGSAVRITIARYSTPSGRIIQRPYENGKRTEYYMEHLKDYGRQDSLSSDTTAVYHTLHSGRKVYGGGGIRPDVTVAVDTTGYSPYYGQMVRKGLFSDFMIDFMDKHRTELETAYPSVGEFIDGYEIGEPLLKAFVAMGEQRGITFREEEFTTSRGWISRQLKALMAQKLYGIAAYYQIINTTDNGAFRRGLEILQHWDTQGSPLLENK